jgi:hypothetical protein
MLVATQLVPLSSGLLQRMIAASLAIGKRITCNLFIVFVLAIY